MSMKSGGRIDLGGFRCGWIKTLPVKSLAHYAVRGRTALVTKCGFSMDRLASDSSGPIAFHPGNWRKCKKCEKALGWGPEDISDGRD